MAEHCKRRDRKQKLAKINIDQRDASIINNYLNSISIKGAMELLFSVDGWRIRHETLQKLILIQIKLGFAVSLL